MNETWMEIDRIDRKVSVSRLIGCLLLFMTILPPSAPAGDGIRIASIFAFSGPAASDNLLSVRGIRFAVQEINRTGGLLGENAELIEYDNRSTPIGAKIAADKAVHDGATAIIGCAWSSHSLAVARVAQANAVPMITNVSTHPDITAIGDCIFRVCYTDPFQGWVMTSFARNQLKARTGVTFKNLTSDFSMSLAREIRKTFEASGAAILADVIYKHRQESYRETVLQAVKLRPDIYFFSGHDESALILKEARRLGLKLLPVGSDGWGSESFFRMSGSTVPIGYYCTHWSEEIDSPRSRAFVKKYKRDGEVIYPQEPLGYDAVMVLADSVRRAGSLDRARIRKALSQTRDFPGVTGDITFNQQGDPAKPAVIIRIADGQQSFIEIIHPKQDPRLSNGIENEQR